VAGALAAGIEPLLVVREGTEPDAPPPAGVRTLATLQPLLELLDPRAEAGGADGGRILRP
ncbi:MAG TPA: hypothetical protein VK506_02530, partial [Conexibacter sp.]|nr:hypothetical protein [Conexibacter sp.]